jgi:hypothetical protein
MPTLRLYQFNELRPCYFCGAPGPSTKEHAPPKSFFEGTPCSSITVPACVKHNSDKARSDLAIKAALLRGVEEMIPPSERAHIPIPLRRSIEAMQDQYRHAGGLVTMKPFISDHPDDAGLQFPFLHEAAQIDSWVRMLTADLVWSVTGTHESGSDWAEAWIWSPSYYPGRKGEPFSFERCRAMIDKLVYTWRNLDESGTWRPGWQPHPHPFPAELYRFDVCLPSKRPPTVVFRHQFFRSHPYFGCFSATEWTSATFDQFLGAELDRLQSAGASPAPVPAPPPRYPNR